MKVTQTLTVIIILIVIAYFTQNHWMPLVNPARETSIVEEEIIEEEEQNEDQEEDQLSYMNNGCVTITSPAVGATMSIPLTVTATIDYGCRVIFEAQAGVVTLEQNGETISTIDPNTGDGLFMVQGEYMDQNNYPVTAQTTISMLSGSSSWAAELIIIPENPCGSAPECPPTPAPILVPVVLQ